MNPSHLHRSKPVCVAPDARIVDIARKMRDENVGAVLVLHEEDDGPRGILTDRDIVIRCIAENIDVADCTAEQILTEKVETIDEVAPEAQALELMSRRGVHRLVTVNQSGQATGLLSL